MKKRYVVISGVALLLIGGLGYAYKRSSMEADRQNKESMEASELTPAVDQPAVSETPSEAPATQDVPVAVSSPGEYLAYDESTLANTSGTRILFFHAPWCPQCRALDADIEKAQLPDGVTIFKTDYDSNQELRQKYGVTLQTTLIKLDASGNLAEKYVAYNEPNYAAVKAALLD